MKTTAENAASKIAHAEAPTPIVGGMSVPSERGRVDRLSKEIASLESKLADERSRAAKERNQSARAADSFSKSRSASMQRQKLKQAQRHEGRAADHDKKAARLRDQIATKQRSLSSAQASLERALKSERSKEEQAARKRREEELRHLRDLEARRGSLQASPAPSERNAAPETTLPGQPGESQFEYDVCLSFAGEDRPYVDMVARELKARGVRVFYDEDETPTLWGKDLAEHLDYIYRVASRFCVLFISEAYARKEWTRHERRSALARAIQEEGEYVLPARFDETELPGLRPTVAYVDLREYAPATLVEFLLEKLNVSGTQRGD